MVRKLKFHEQKLLKKVDFISWKLDNNLNEVKAMKKYHIQKREDYTKLVSLLSLCLTALSNFGVTTSICRLPGITNYPGK